MKEASAESSQRIGCAISSGSAQRFIQIVQCVSQIFTRKRSKNAAIQRNAVAFERRADAPRRHRNALIVGDFENVRHLLPGRRPDDDFAWVGGVVRLVTRMQVEIGLSRADVGLAGNRA